MTDSLSLFDWAQQPAKAKAPPPVAVPAASPADPTPSPRGVADSTEPIPPELPDGFRWQKPPTLMPGDFTGTFLSDGSANLWYPRQGGWGRRCVADFAPGEWEKLEPGVSRKIEHWVGAVVAPDGQVEFLSVCRVLEEANG